MKLKNFLIGRWMMLWMLCCISTSAIYSQCVRIESILVDACIGGAGLELDNEMLRFRVGPNPLNVSNMNMNFGFGQPFMGIVTPNTTTASLVNQFNNTIQSCGWLLEPTGGILPANSKVLVIGSTLVSVTANPFNNLSDTLYVIFMNFSLSSNAYFINYALPGTTVAPDNITVTLSFGVGCTSSVTYYRPSLVRQNGTPGAQDGAIVNFDINGTPTYINNGCSAPYVPFSAQWTNPGTICNNAAPVNMNAYVTGTPGGTWSGQGISGSTFNPAGLSGSIPITYTVNIGACNRVSTQNINVSPVGNPSWTPPTGVCTGDLISLPPLVTGTAGGTWSGQGVSGTNFNATGLSGNINVTYTVGSGSCQATSTQAINVTSAGSPAWTNPGTVCASASPINLNSLVTGTQGGTWSGQGVSGNTFNPSGLSGNIQVTYTLSSGNCTVTSSQLINVGSAANASWTPPSGVCSGDVISLNSLITGTTGGTWSGQGVTGTTFNSAGLSGNISITYTVGTGSCQGTSTQNIQVIASANSAWTNPGVICNNVSPVDLTTYVTGTTGGTWAGQGVSSAGLFNPAGLNGSVPVTYTVGSGNCQSQTVQNISVQSFTTFPLTADKNIMCAGDSTPVCAPTGYQSYNWNVGGNTNCVMAKQAGAYYVTVTDANGCVGESQRANLSIYPVPSISILVNGDTLSSFGAVSYQWFLNGNAIPGATSPVYIATQSGSYTLRITDANGCSSTSTPVNITKTNISELLEKEVSIYPNPSSGNRLFIKLPPALYPARLTMYDDRGSLVREAPLLSGESDIDFDVARGVYFVRIGVSNDYLIRKVVKF